MVGFDSIIPAGQVGSITEKVRLTNYHSGSYSKAATINSNAKKTPSLTISMKWVIKAYVAVSPSYIEVNRNKDGIFQARWRLKTPPPTSKGAVPPSVFALNFPYTPTP